MHLIVIISTSAISRLYLKFFAFTNAVELFYAFGCNTMEHRSRARRIRMGSILWANATNDTLKKLSYFSFKQTI